MDQLYEIEKLEAKNEQLQSECAELMQEVFKLREQLRDYEYVTEN